MNIKYRLMIIFSVMTVIPLLIMFIMAAFSNYNSIDSTLFEARLKSVHTNATHIQNYLEDQKNALDILADEISGDNTDKTKIMRLFKSKHTEWEYLYFVDKDGQVSLIFPYTDLQGDTDFSQREWFTSLRNNTRPYMSDIIISHATNATTFFIAYPVLAKDGTFEGVVGANLSLDFLNTSLPYDLQISPTSQTILVDKTSRILASSNKITSFSPWPFS